MRIEGMEGEVYFTCLVRCSDGWETSELYFSSKEDAQKHYDKEIKWPIEMCDDHMIYVPDEVK